MTQSCPCYHCGLPADPVYRSVLNNVSRDFCCIGCQAVAHAIVDTGLSDFYRYRESESLTPETSLNDYLIYDRADLQQDFVRTVDAKTQTARLYIGGVTCAACVWLIEKYLKDIKGVIQVTVNTGSQQAVIAYEPEAIRLSEIFQRLSAIGFAPQPLVAQVRRDNWQRERRQDLTRLGVAGIGMMQAGMVSIGLHAGDMQGMEPQFQNLLRWVCMLLTAPVLFYSAQPFFRAAWRALRMGHIIMDTPVSLALTLAFNASVYATVSRSGEVYFDSVAMFTFFLLLGRHIEKVIRYRNWLAAAGRAQLLPVTAERIDADGVNRVIPARELQIDDRVHVAAGAVFPCDGVILEGRSETVEALITGESLPVPKGPGEHVIAGSLNGGSPLRVLATAVGTGTQVAAIEQLMEQAELDRPSQVAVADRIARRFSPTILTIAAAVFFFWWFRDADRALWITLSVLVVTCPCALSLATPTAVAAATHRLRQCGWLLTGESALETLARSTHVVFDKTGTLTEGMLQVNHVEPLDDRAAAVILNIAAALEQGSGHPIARAFREHHRNLIVTDQHVEVGEGVSGNINGHEFRLGTPAFASGQPMPYPGPGLWLLMSEDRRPVGWIRLDDTLRGSAQESVQALQQQDLRITLLSGDRVGNVQEVAVTLGIDHWSAALLPADKVEQVRSFQARGDIVLMVGDGVNDVPVLAAADVSIAMGSATQLAQTRADAVLLNEDLRQIPFLLGMAKRVRRVIVQNLSWAIAYNAVALPFAIAGWVPPWLAALGMSASSMIVVLNAWRIQRF